MNEKKLLQIFKSLLEIIGENPNREGLIDTPKRMVKSYKELFKGYDLSKKPGLTTFKSNIKEMIIKTNIPIYSVCEHHMLPIFGVAHFAYIPKGKIVGISKIPRLIRWHASKLIIQENLTEEIIDDFCKEIRPLGAILIIKARHLCEEMRGVKTNSETITSAVRGIFLKAEPGKYPKEEFLRLISEK